MYNEILPPNLMSKLPFGGTLSATDIVDSGPNQDHKVIAPEVIVGHPELTFFTLAPLYKGIRYLSFDLYDQFRADVYEFHNIQLPRIVTCRYNRELIRIFNNEKLVPMGDHSVQLNALPNNVFPYFKEWLKFQAFKSEGFTWVVKCGRFRLFDPVDKSQSELACIHVFLPWSSICSPQVEVDNDFVIIVRNKFIQSESSIAVTH